MFLKNKDGRMVVRLSDTTTHGGQVITGCDHWTLDGRPVARVGDMVMCPQCNNQAYPIVQGDATITQEGRPIAFEGHLTACGAQLISSLQGSQSAAQPATQTALTEPARSKNDKSDYDWFYGNKEDMQTNTGLIPRGLYFPYPATTRQPLTMENTQKWLYYAMNAEDSGLLDAYTYLSFARNRLGLDKNDSNLAAAERYAEGYFGNYSKPWLFGQDFLKRIREIPVVGPIFGKNGSPVSDSDFVTVWGFMGVEHRKAYIEKYGTEPKRLDRVLLGRERANQ